MTNARVGSELCKARQLVTESILISTLVVQTKSFI